MRQGHLKVRKARDADIDVLLALSEQLGYPAAREDFQKRFSVLSQDDNHVVFVAEAEDQAVVGWVHVLSRVLLVSEPMAEIGGLVVDEKNRGKGIGRVLLAAAEKWVKSKNISTMVVRSNVIRQEAHEFYPKMGFTHVKSQHVYKKGVAPPTHSRSA
jgi:GNAT superfamily N-acetyltransferase